MSFLLLFGVPVLSGLLLLWVSRNERRARFVQQRLHTLTVGPGDEGIPHQSLSRRLRAATLTVLPRKFRIQLDAAFEATGNKIRLFHLALAGFTTAIIVILFSLYILAVTPISATLLSIVAAAIAPIVLIRLGQLRYQKRFLDAFPDALDLVSRAVKAGLPVNEALHSAGQESADPVGHELRSAFEQVQVGVPMIDALQETANRIRVTDFRFMVVALALQAKTGGSLAETLGNLSKVLRDRRALRLKARALSAEAKVSAGILAALPFLVGGTMSILNPDLMHLLLFDPRGRVMMGAAFLSLLTGLGTMYVMVKKAMR